jgi:hypothetical protein
MCLERIADCVPRFAAGAQSFYQAHQSVAFFLFVDTFSLALIAELCLSRAQPGPVQQNLVDNKRRRLVAVDDRRWYAH